MKKLTLDNFCTEIVDDTECFGKNDFNVLVSQYIFLSSPINS